MPPKKPPQDPPLFTATTKSIIQDAERLIQKRIQDEKRIPKDPATATFQNVIIPLVMIENSQRLEERIILFYADASADPSLRKASLEAKAKLSDSCREESLHDDLCDVIHAVVKRGESLDYESRKLLESLHADFIGNGHGILTELLNWVHGMQRRISELSLKLYQNSTDRSQGIWFTLNELDGVPPSILDRFSRDDSLDPCQLFVSLNSVDIDKYAKRSETRKRIFIERENQFAINVPILKEILVLRDAVARLFRYANHAESQMQNRPIRSTQLTEFLDYFRERLSLNAANEKKKLMEIKRDHCDEKDNDGNLYLWDFRFCHRILKQELYIAPSKVSEYFQLDVTVDGMFEIFAKLFGLAFVKDEGTDMQRYWHEDVKLFHVWDSDSRGGAFVGYLYMDPYARENKDRVAQTNNLQPVSSLKFDLLNTNFE